MCCEKDLSYEEAKQLCRIAFDAGADYGSTSMQFNCNAVAYDWEHWLKKNECLFKPKPTVEDVLREFGKGWYEQMSGPETFDIADYVERYAAKLRLAGEDE